MLSTILTFHFTCEFLVTFRIGYICSLTLEICCLTLGTQIDFGTEAMLCKVCRPGDGKPGYVFAENAHPLFLLRVLYVSVIRYTKNVAVLKPLRRSLVDRHKP